jgi:hypothetical protein
MFTCYITKKDLLFALIFIAVCLIVLFILSALAYNDHANTKILLDQYLDIMYIRVKL